MSELRTKAERIAALDHRATRARATIGELTRVSASIGSATGALEAAHVLATAAGAHEVAAVLRTAAGEARRASSATFHAIAELEDAARTAMLDRAAEAVPA